jgi:hypothetical protein
MGLFRWAPKTKWQFLGNSCNDFDQISAVLEGLRPTYNCRDKSALGSQTQNFVVVETGYTSRTDFVVVRHSETNSGLPKNN